MCERYTDQVQVTRAAADSPVWIKFRCYTTAAQCKKVL